MTAIEDVWDIPQKIPAILKNEEEHEKKIITEEREYSNKYNVDIQSLLIEIHELRREQAQRCTVYMIMIAILFGIVIVYIDRLNNSFIKQNRNLLLQE